MPLYEYRCNDCAAVYEVMRPMAERELAAVCPGCESRASMPLISRVGMLAAAQTGTSARPGARPEAGAAAAPAAAERAERRSGPRAGQP